MAEKSYAELAAEHEKIRVQMEEARARELGEVIERIRGEIHTYGLTEKDLFGRRSKKAPGAAKTPREPKYLNPKTGETWSGFGRTPAWLKSPSARKKFLIIKDAES